MNNQTPSQMTIKDYSEYTGLADSTIRRKIKAGLLQAYQVDGRWLVDVDDNAAPKQSSQTTKQTPSHDDPAPLVAQLQSENQHLRDQVDKLTQVLAMQTQQNSELTKQLPAIERIASAVENPPSKASFTEWVRSTLSRLSTPSS